MYYVANIYYLILQFLLVCLLYTYAFEALLTNWTISETNYTLAFMSKLHYMYINFFVKMPVWPIL